MPLSTTELLEETLRTDAGYLIFFASLQADGHPWCPDCRAVEDLVKDTFKPEDGPDGLLVYVGDKPTWKSPKNVFRGEPWKVKVIPTIIKLHDGKEVKRLEDQDEVRDGLADLVKEDDDE